MRQNEKLRCYKCNSFGHDEKRCSNFNKISLGQNYSFNYDHNYKSDSHSSNYRGLNNNYGNRKSNYNGSI